MVIVTLICYETQLRIATKTDETPTKTDTINSRLLKISTETIFMKTYSKTPLKCLTSYETKVQQ